MKKLHRDPKVTNHYNLTYDSLKHLELVDRSKVCEPIFWRNKATTPNSWCLLRGSGHGFYDEPIDEFWLGIYDEPKNGKLVDFHFTSYEGMTGYTFDKFYDPKDIEFEEDLEIQEKALYIINLLLDLNVLKVG